MKLLHRIRGKTGQRCLSFFLAFAMLIGLMPAMLPAARAATPGVQEWHLEEMANGQYRVWGTGIPNKPGSTLGGISFDPYYIRDSDGREAGHLANNASYTWKWTDDTRREAYTFDCRFYPDYIGPQGVNFRVNDSTAGPTTSFIFSFRLTPSAKNQNPEIRKPMFMVYEVNPRASGFYYYLFTGHALGKPLTDIRVMWSKDGVNFDNYSIIADRPVSHIGNTITGLENGKTYYVKFQATNPAGTSETQVYKVVPGTPTAPTNPKTTVGSGSVTFTWEPPTDLREGKLQGYRIYRYAGDTSPVATLSPDVRTYTLSGLSNGTYFTGNGTENYGVRAVVEYGEGEFAAFPKNFWVGAPQAPNAPSVQQQSGTQQLTISTNAPNNNGAAITKYNIYVNGTLKKTINASTLNTTLNASSDLGLANSTSYRITISAVNSRGEGFQSAATTFTTNGAPAKPTLSSAEATKVTGQVKLTWTTPANNGGAITSVQVLQNGSVVKTLSASATPNEWQAGKMDTPGQTCTNFVTGLKDGTNYSFQVRAVNAYGQGTLSDAKSAMPYRIPDAPTGLKVTRGVRSLTLNWTAANNGGNTVSKYNVCDSAKIPQIP